MYNSFHWASLNWKRHAYIAVVLVKNTKFLIYLSTEPTYMWQDTEMLDRVHIWSKTHIHSLPHLKHTQQLSQIHFHTLLTRYLLGHKISRCTCQFRFCKGNRCLVQMSVLSLELWDYHMRRALITDARSSGVTSEEQKH